MRSIDLFQKALGLPEPWEVVRTEFSTEERRLDLYLDFPKGARFPCPEEDEDACPIHDTQEKTWRHLDFFQHQAYLHARVPRVNCPNHGVRQIEVPWARPGSGFTVLFEALLLELVREMPVAAVARIVGEHDTRLWRLVEHYVAEARGKVEMDKVTSIGIDETSAKRGQDYISIFYDFDGRRVLYSAEGREAAVVGRFAEDLRAHRGDPLKITDVCCDMWGAYIRGVERYLPEAEITFDRYHLAQMLTRAVDEVRKIEVRSRPALKGTKYLWLKRPEKLTDRQAAEIAYLTTHHQALVTARAYRWRLTFDGFFEVAPEEAEAYLERWYQGAIRSRISQIRDFAFTVRDHWEGVLRWHRRKINIGVLEGINSLVQAAKRRARGYRTKKNLISIVYLIAGRLELGLAHTK